MEIIQHYEPVDFNALFAEKQIQQIGPDFNKIAAILHTGNEVHSFFGSAELKDIAYNALANTYASDETVENTQLQCRYPYLYHVFARN